VHDGIRGGISPAPAPAPARRSRGMTFSSPLPGNIHSSRVDNARRGVTGLGSSLFFFFEQNVMGLQAFIGPDWGYWIMNARKQQTTAAMVCDNRAGEPILI
jgi:hypothetical protein